MFGACCAYVNEVSSALSGALPALPWTSTAAAARFAVAVRAVAADPPAGLAATLALPALLACLVRPRGSASTQVSATPSRMHRWQGRASSQTVLHTLHRAQTRFAFGRRIGTVATTVGGWAGG